jgi:hypothetical protein
LKTQSDRCLIDKVYLPVEKSLVVKDHKHVET